MRHPQSRARSALCLLLSLGCAVVIARAQQDGRRAAGGHVISGRVIDPLGLNITDTALVLEAEGEPRGFAYIKVPVRNDGSFVTPEQPAGTYVLEVVRTPFLPPDSGAVVGLTIVSLTTEDVTGVTVALQRDTVLEGRFRMESDNPAATWPPHIAVSAYLALDGSALRNPIGAEGASGGRFILRNAFGPRVLRPGYTLAPGYPWWPTRVLLNGTDVTNVPTDFSKYPNADLQLVFTQHPARFAGTVRDGQNQPVPGAWVLTWAADRSPPQPWETTSHAVQANANGAFRFSSLPGRYVARAFAPTTFPTADAALQHVAPRATDAVTVDLDERGLQRLDLTIGRQ